MPLRIGIVTPAPPGSRKGNRVTAVRWARLLRELRHRVSVTTRYRDERLDVLVALHARHGAAAVERFREVHPGCPVVVALTGTDLYGDLERSAVARKSLALATRLVALQPDGIEALPEVMRGKARAIFQSAIAPRGHFTPSSKTFEVSVLGHLRAVKDPLRAALAARRLPASSRIRVLQVGGALDETHGRRATAEAARNPRYRWLGEVPRWRALRILARSRLLVLSSRMEGGANVVSEAIAAGVPVVSSHISGSVGMLGADYPGYFPVGDTRALAALMHRAETDGTYYDTLARWCAGLKPLVDPARERASWAALLAEVTPAEPCR